MTALVILLGALVPLISQAGYHFSGDETWLDICTPSGLERIAIDADSGGSQDPVAGQSCAWCNLHSGTCGLPSAEVVFAAHHANDTVRVFSEPHSQQPRLAWPTAQPRAPPRG